MRHAVLAGDEAGLGLTKSSIEAASLGQPHSNLGKPINEPIHILSDSIG